MSEGITPRRCRPHRAVRLRELRGGGVGPPPRHVEGDNHKDGGSDPEGEARQGDPPWVGRPRSRSDTVNSPRPVSPAGKRVTRGGTVPPTTRRRTPRRWQTLPPVPMRRRTPPPWRWRAPHQGGGEPTELSARPPVRGHPGDIDGQRPGVEKRKERETEERDGEKKDGYICLRSVGEQKEGRLLAGDADQKGQGYTQWVATEGAHTQVTEEVTDPVNERKNTHGLWN